MMKYEMFKNLVTEKFRDYLPDQYKDMEMKIVSLNKINRVREGINLIDKNESVNISPTVYIDDMYAHYCQCEDLDIVIRSAVENLEQAIHGSAEFADIDFSDAKENIVFQLVNTEQNRAMLAEVPHREFHDLSVVYRWLLKQEDGMSCSMPINNSVAQRMGLTEKELFTLAAENTRRITPPCVRNMKEIMYDMFVKDGMPPCMAESLVNEMSENVPMYVISNEKTCNGAAAMLYEDVLHELAVKLESDLYILPSSVHEVIAILAAEGDVNELAQHVFEVNMEQVELSERLSNQVYHYDKDLRKLSLATDTPNKRLDGLVSESSMIYETGQHR